MAILPEVKIARIRDAARMNPVGLTSGARDLSGAFVAVLAFGIGFGAAAVAANIPPSAAIAMSALVFAGASQYAALDLWAAPLPLLSLALMTLVLNARHLIFGMTLRDYLANHGRASRYAALALLSDANWASTQQAIARGERSLGYLVGGGLVLWSAWTIGTIVGSLAGSAVGDPHRFGLDAIMPTFFVCSLIGMVRARADLAPWILAAGLAAALTLAMPSQWAILIGAGSGALFGVLRDE